MNPEPAPHHPHSPSHSSPSESHASPSSSSLITEVQVREMLKLVEDPELHMDIITLELVYGVQVVEKTVKVTMTLTTPACPYGPMLIEAVKQAVKKIPNVEHVEVIVTFEPMWQPSDDLKAMMGLL
ncbi:MAG: metal-sulfur cluster assembly factor [archaeon]